MKLARWSLIAALILLLVLAFTMDAGGSPSDFSLFVGRFHPTLVHLPIGILLLALLLEGLKRVRRFAQVEAAIPPVFYVGAWTAILASLAGLYLSQGGGYEIGDITWHKRLGILVALFAGAAYFLKTRDSASKRLQQGYVVLLAGMLVSIAIGGHLGGSLTHGDGYLTRYMPDGLRAVIGLPAKGDIGRLQIDNLEEAPAYSFLIQPILEDRCVACHNPSKTKGGLRLDTPEGILEGGDDGDVLVAGQSEESELIRRIWLPAAHDDHMPPEGNPPLTVAQAELLRWWIDQGASFEHPLAEIEIPPTVQTILDGYGLDEIRTGIFALDVSPPDSSAIDALRGLGVTVTPLAENEPFLQVRCTPADACLRADQADALRPLAQQIAWLDLGRTGVNDTTLAVVAALPHLTRLHLERTTVTDNGLRHLKDLEYLEYLNLYGTSVSDEGLQHLVTLPRLRALYLWQTQVTEAGLQPLQEALPDLDANLGLTLDAPVSEASSTEDS